MIVSIEKVSTFNDNTFEGTNEYGDKVVCHFANPEQDWDVLYERLMGSIEVEVLQNNGNNDYVVQL